MATRLRVDGLEVDDVIAELRKLPEGTAVKTFERFYKYTYYPELFKKKNYKVYNYKLDPQYIERQLALDEVNAFNRTLRSSTIQQQQQQQRNKPSLWEKLIDFFD